MVSNTGPYYIDAVVKQGEVEVTFGLGSGEGEKAFRVDRFFSDVTHARLCGAVSELTKLDEGGEDGEGKVNKEGRR